MTRLLALLVAEGTGLWVTHRLSAPYRAALDLGWLSRQGLGGLMVAVMHLAAWVAMWWLVTGTAHDLTATAMAIGRPCGRRPTRLAPAWVRRVVDQALGTILMVGVVAGPAAGATPPPGPVATHQVVAPPVPVIGSPTSPPAVGLAGAAPTPPPPRASDPVASTPPVGAPDSTPAPAEPPPAASTADVTPPGMAHPGSHVVAAGENLWVIARSTLTERAGTAPDDRRTHRYWLRLIQANQVTSGDPDLIYPGERLTLPALGPDDLDGEDTAP